MSGWRISTVKRNDLASILAIERCSFQCPWGLIAFEGELNNRSAFNYAVKSAATGGTDQIFGYAFLRLIFEELHLLKIAVTPIRRGQGVATWILKRCFAAARRRGAESVHLEVRPSNAPAVCLYEKLGFEIIGRRPCYYADSSEDALMMIKKL